MRPQIYQYSYVNWPGFNPCAIGSLFQNISLAVLLNLGIKTAWILANQAVQNQVGHAAFGTYLALFALGFLFIAFSDMGINQYATKTLAGAPDRLRELYPQMLGMKLLLCLFYPVLMLGVGWLFRYPPEALFMLFFIALTHGVMQITVFFRAGFQAFQWFRADAVASVLDRFLLLCLVGVLLWRGITLDAYVYAVLVSALLTLAVLWVLTQRWLGSLRPRFSRSQAGTLLRETFPFAVITVLYSVNDKVDQVMLERLLPNGAEETGLYGAAYRWVDTVMMYLWTVLPIFFARFAHVSRDPAEQMRLLRFGQPLAALPMIFAAVFVQFYGEKLLFLFKDSTPEEREIMLRCMRILFISVAVNGVFAIYSTLLTATGHERFVSWMIGFSILLNVGLNFFLIPHWGAEAAAWDTLVSFSFLSLSYLIWITARLEVRVPWSVLLRTLLAGLLFTAVFYALAQTALAWWLVSAAAGVILLAAGFILRLLPYPLARNHG